MGREIWIVDDEPAICRALERWLRSRGQTVRSFADCPEADAALVRQPAPALLIVDARLGPTSSLPWIRTVRNSLPGIKLVLMSGGMEQRSVDQLMRDKVVDGFLEKPWDDAVLERMLAALLQPLAPASHA